MKFSWLTAASIAIAATTGLSLAACTQQARAQAPAYHLSDDGEATGAAPTAAAAKVEAADWFDTTASLSDMAGSELAGSELAGSVLAAAPGCEPCQAPAEEPECEPWRLFCQKDCGWNIYGWAAGGFMGNSQSPASDFNGPTTFPDQDTGQFNQFYAIAERTIDTGGCGWDWGGRVDVLYGSDYIFTQAIGLETDADGSARWNGNPDYGVALPQAYAELGYNRLSAKVGHFYTPMGYEVVPVTGNFFYSHAYTMQYGEPFTHTGGIGTLAVSDNLTVLGAIVNGWDALDRTHDAAMFIAGAAWTGDGGLSLAYNFGFSNREPTIDGDLTNRNISSLVLTYERCDWTYVLQNDIGWQQGADPGANFTQWAEWYGVNQYLFYTINECWKAGARFEWFRDDDGVRVGGVRPGNPLPVAGGQPGFAGNFYEVTFGLNWTPHANFTLRPEVRYDWYDGDSAPGGVQPFDDGTEDDQFLYGVDLILVW